MKKAPTIQVGAFFILLKLRRPAECRCVENGITTGVFSGPF